MLQTHALVWRCYFIEEKEKNAKNDIFTYTGYLEVSI